MKRLQRTMDMLLAVSQWGGVMKDQCVPRVWYIAHLDITCSGVRDAVEVIDDTIRIRISRHSHSSPSIRHRPASSEASPAKRQVSPKLPSALSAASIARNIPKRCRLGST
jgi:hypothetical protein